MTQTVREVRERTVEDSSVDTTPANTQVDRSTNIAARAIGFMGGIIMSLLALRFLLALMGANRGNTFVDLIYDASRPFAAPFFGMFNYTPQIGVSRFEFETLVAIIVYALVTWGLMYLVTIADRQRR